MSKKKTLTRKRFSELFYWGSDGFTIFRKIACKYKPGADKDTEAGCIKGDGYCYVGIGSVEYKRAWLVWWWATGSWPKDQLDHENHSRADDRLENLREATCKENQQNRPLRKDNTTGHTNIRITSSKTKGTRYEATMPPSKGRPWRTKTVGTLEKALYLRDQAYKEANYHPNHANRERHNNDT